MRRALTSVPKQLATVRAVTIRPNNITKVATVRTASTATAAAATTSRSTTTVARRGVLAAGVVLGAAVASTVGVLAASNVDVKQQLPQMTPEQEKQYLAAKAKLEAEIADLRNKVKSSAKPEDMRELGLKLGQLGENHRESIEWLDKAAQKGDGAAASVLADLYHSGLEEIGILADIGKAQKYWKIAIDAGNLDAMRDFGAIKISGGGGVEKNAAEGMGLLERAAELKDPQAAFMLYYIHNAGVEVPRNAENAIKWLNKAADLDHTLAHVEIACRTLGHMKERNAAAAGGTGGVAALTPADEQQIYTQAQARLERVLTLATQRRAADMGDLMGQCIAVYLLGAITKNGYGVPIQSFATGDATEAIRQGGSMQQMAVDFAREGGMEIPSEIVNMIPNRTSDQIRQVALKAKAEADASNAAIKKL